MSGNTQEDGFEFVRQMWGKMGFGLPGMVTPTLDTDELERRIKDLQAVEGWLKMNLGMLQMTIQGLEVQRSTLVAMHAMQQAGSEGEATNPFANAALWTWPFGKTETAGDTASPAAEAPPESTEQPDKNRSPNNRRKS
jgi:hypothetical protein